MENFEQKLIATVQDKICKDLAKQDYVRVEYGDRISIPAGFIQEMYQKLDIEKIKAKLIENLENEMANTIARRLITEYANDIKQVMGNRELREELRGHVRNKVKEIVNRVSE